MPEKSPPAPEVRIRWPRDRLSTTFDTRARNPLVPLTAREARAVQVLEHRHRVLAGYLDQILERPHAEGGVLPEMLAQPGLEVFPKSLRIKKFGRDLHGASAVDQVPDELGGAIRLGDAARELRHFRHLKAVACKLSLELSHLQRLLGVQDGCRLGH